HDRHVSLVPVAERLRGALAVDSAPNEPRHICPPLDRDLCDTRKWLRRLAPDAEQASSVSDNRRRVANGEHIWVTWDRQVRVHFDTPCSVDVDTEPRARRRGDNTRRPQHRA